MIRSAIRGDLDCLGELCELVRPNVFAFTRRRLLPFGFESDAEDVVQNVFLDILRSFPKYDPTVVPFFPWLWKIVRNNIHDHVNIDLVRLMSERLPDNSEAKGDELQADPLDRMSHEAWSADVPELPTPVPRDRTVPRRRGYRRTAAKALKERQRKRGEAEKAERMASGKRRRNRKFIPPQRVTAIRRRREAFAEASP